MKLNATILNEHTYSMPYRPVGSNYRLGGGGTHYRLGGAHINFLFFFLFFFFFFGGGGGHICANYWGGGGHGRPPVPPYSYGPALLHFIN